MSVVAVLFLLCIFMMFSEHRDDFFSKNNFQLILLRVSLLSIFAIGETIVIITGGIDLSLGSLIAFSGMVVSFLVTELSNKMIDGVAIMVATVLTLAIALAIGSLHATLIHKIKLPPFVVTLASLLILRSQALVLNGMLPISISKFPALLFLANGSLFKGTPFALPMPLVILLIVAVIATIILSRMRVGRYLYSIGSNEQATGLSGVSVYKTKLFAYGASALLGGLSGILYAAYGSQGNPQSGSGYELEAVAASVVGGANLLGGQGSIAGTVLGATLLRVIGSVIFFEIRNASKWESTIVGGILLLAVLVNALQQRRTASRA